MLMLVSTEAAVAVELTLGFSHPLLLPLGPPFFHLKILDSRTLTGCLWEICMHPSSLQSSSDEDCGLCMVTGGESS